MYGEGDDRQLCGHMCPIVSTSNKNPRNNHFIEFSNEIIFLKFFFD